MQVDVTIPAMLWIGGGYVEKYKTIEVAKGDLPGSIRLTIADYEVDINIEHLQKAIRNATNV